MLLTSLSPMPINQQLISRVMPACCGGSFAQSFKDGNDGMLSRKLLVPTVDFPSGNANPHRCSLPAASQLRRDPNFRLWGTSPDIRSLNEI